MGGEGLDGDVGVRRVALELAGSEHGRLDGAGTHEGGTRLQQASEQALTACRQPRPAAGWACTSAGRTRWASGCQAASRAAA